MDSYGLAPILSLSVALGPAFVMLCILVVFLARHFRVSLLLMAIAEVVWLCVGGYSQYLMWSGNWNEAGMERQLVLNGVSQIMTVLNIAGMLLLLMEWSKLVRERSEWPPPPMM